MRAKLKDRLREVLKNYRRNAGRFPGLALRRIDQILHDETKEPTILPDMTMGYEDVEEHEIDLLANQEHLRRHHHP